MKLFTDVWVLTLRKIRETLRQPVWVVLTISFPIVFLILYSPLLDSLRGVTGFNRGSVLDVFVPGMMVMLAYINVSSSGYWVMSEQESGVLERLRVTPVSRFALLMGGVLRDVVTMVVPALVVIAVTIPFGFRPQWGGMAILLVLLALLTVAGSAAFSALALVLRSQESLSSISSGTMFPLILLSGMMLPISLAPLWMRVVAHFDPLYYVVEGSRDLAYGVLTSPTVGIAFLVMGGLALLTTAWSTRVFRRAAA